MLRSTDGLCRYVGVVHASMREPHGLGEHLMATASNGKITDWMTAVSDSACLKNDGTYLKRPVSLGFVGGPWLHVGDRVVLRSIK